ncbi:capsule biosynthesis protein [Paracoccus sp. (in: a-proteobacteria)]|uniref:capsule biosynthesis protein n=1 Tax=Paracoccus sp. TaxID=267 RepID=UPI00289F568A|nr:capsule biosynthesis protein [Paracoccus sp. (in: a-proteobacteria)]
MTTPPKARLFRVSRSESAVAQARGAAGERVIKVEVHKQSTATNPDELFNPGQQDDGFGDMKFGQAANGPTAGTPAGAPGDSAVGENSMAARIAAVRGENLTGRQLRMARRIAGMNDIQVESDFEAVVILRDRGIDPFHRTEVGNILSSEGAKVQAKPPAQPAPGKAVALKANQPLPSRMPREKQNTPALPSREALTEDRRAAEIYRIQRDIAKRRRRRMIMLAGRLFAFVALPTLLAAYYYFVVATPLYGTHSQFLIQQAEKSSSGGLGSLFGGTQLATNTDSVSVQSYLTSRDAMMRLDKDLGFKKAFQDASIDPIQRLPADATNEQTYKVYKNSVKIGYDPTEGVINMEVIAPDPKLSLEFSTALIAYAEGQVDQMTTRLRSDQMKGAAESYQDAEAKVQAAQLRVLELQQKLGVLDPVAEGTVVMNQVAELERQLNAKKLELGQLQANSTPNRSRVQGVKGDITRLEGLLEQTRARLTEDNASRGSLAAISGEIRIAESDLLTRQGLLSAAAAQMETARIEANKQVRYLSLSVAPVPPDQASYPKAFQNTIVAFLIFSGIYLMLSLTASILREQVSS